MITRKQIFAGYYKTVSKEGQLRMKATSYMKMLDFATELYTNGDSKILEHALHLSMKSDISNTGIIAGKEIIFEVVSIFHF